MRCKYLILICIIIIIIINLKFISSEKEFKWKRSVEQIHLALTGHESNSMLLTFVTKWYGNKIIKDNNEIYQWNKECPSPTVEYKMYNNNNNNNNNDNNNSANTNNDDKSIVNRVTASSFHYKLSDGYKDNWNGTIHDALMYDLAPNQVYQYRIGIVEDCWNEMVNPLKYTKWFIFKTSTHHPHHMVNQNSFNYEFSFVFFGDCGIGDVYNQLANNLQSKVNFTNENDNNINLALILGDIPYASMDGFWDFTIPEYRQHKAIAWDNWFYLSEKFTSSIPIMTIPGNHETLRFDDRQMIPYISRFHMPYGRDTHIRWYSFTNGFIHFIMLSSEHDLSPTSSQYNFLMNDLITINKRRNEIPWIIVAAHRPMYASTIRKGREGSDTHLRRCIESLLVKYHVDLYLSGHHHAYERTFPMDGKQSYKIHDTRSGIWKGVVHIRAGTGGMQPHRKRIKPYPKYTARRLPGPGYVQADLKSKVDDQHSNQIEHSLKLSFINTNENRVKDQVTLKRYTSMSSNSYKNEL